MIRLGGGVWSERREEPVLPFGPAPGTQPGTCRLSIGFRPMLSGQCGKVVLDWAT